MSTPTSLSYSKGNKKVDFSRSSIKPEVRREATISSRSRSEPTEGRTRGRRISKQLVKTPQTQRGE
jgi:hypothetical protein